MSPTTFYFAFPIRLILPQATLLLPAILSFPQQSTSSSLSICPLRALLASPAMARGHRVIITQPRDTPRNTQPRVPDGTWSRSSRQAAARARARARAHGDAPSLPSRKKPAAAACARAPRSFSVSVSVCLSLSLSKSLSLSLSEIRGGTGARAREGCVLRVAHLHGGRGTVGSIGAGRRKGPLPTPLPSPLPGCPSPSTFLTPDPFSIPPVSHLRVPVPFHSTQIASHR